MAERQARAPRKRWLIASFQQGGLDGTFWGVGEAASHYSEGFAGYSKGLAREVIAEIRTDLDAFSDTEAAVLRTTDTFSPTRRCAGTWEASSPIPLPPSAVPHPDWLPPARSEEAIRAALAGSATRKTWGRG